MYTWKESQNKISVLNVEPDRKYWTREGQQVGNFYPCKVPRRGICTQTQVKQKPSLESMAKLITDLGIEGNQFLSTEQKEKLKNLVIKYKDVFSKPGSEIGKTDIIEFDVVLKDKNTPPIRSKVRPLNPKQLESLRKQLDVWEEESIIEPINSPWASPLVPAIKKDGSIRWAIDYRGLNQHTVSDSFPLPNISQNLE